jgi:hypothetical protein
MQERLDVLQLFHKLCRGQMNKNVANVEDKVQQCSKTMSIVNSEMFSVEVKRTSYKTETPLNLIWARREWFSFVTFAVLIGH